MNNSTKFRNNTIDLLKFLCMIGVILIHLTGQGGLINYQYNSFFSYNFYLLFNNVLRICLNIFCIITGYLYISKSKIYSRNIVNIISNVILYSIIIVLIFYSFNLFNVKNLGLMYMINSIFPSMIGRYWFITCYILLFFMIPYINYFINSISKNVFKKLLIILFILLCIIPELLCYDYFRLEFGYSPFWLIYLYLIGAYIRLYGIEISSKKKIVIVLLSILINCLIVFYTKNYLSSSNLFYHLGEYYVSPFMVIPSVLLFDLFSHVNINNVLISRIGKYSLAVYIIHCHRLIYDWIIKDRMIFIKTYNIIIELLILILTSFAIYLVCMFIEIVKNRLFELFKINKLINKIGDRLDGVLSWK